MTKNPTLLVISSYADSLIRFRFDLLKDAVSAGFEVHACAPDLNDELRHKLAQNQIQTHDIKMSRTGVNPIRDFTTLVSLFKVMRKVKPTHTLSYTIKPVVYGCLIARLCGVKHISALITGLGYAFMSASTLSQKLVGVIARTLYKLSLSGCKVAFFQNPDDRDLFLNLKLARSAQCKIVNGSGINTQLYDVTPLPDDNNIHFLMIARLIKDKGVMEYVEAAKKIQQTQNNAVFHLVGWFDSNPTAVKPADVEQWSKQSIIQFHGKLDDVRPAISACHVYVLPSYREGTPRTVLEAMAMGRGIITTDAPGCRETVSQGVNGLLCETRDVDSLVDAINTLLDQEDLIAEFGVQSRKIAVEKYDVKRVNQSMLNEMKAE